MNIVGIIGVGFIAIGSFTGTKAFKGLINEKKKRNPIVWPFVLTTEALGIVGTYIGFVAGVIPNAPFVQYSNLRMTEIHPNIFVGNETNDPVFDISFKLIDPNSHQTISEGNIDGLSKGTTRYADLTATKIGNPTKVDLCISYRGSYGFDRLSDIWPLERGAADGGFYKIDGMIKTNHSWFGVDLCD